MLLGFVEDNKISKIIDTSHPEKFLSDGWIKIPDYIYTGTDIRYFSIDDDNWVRKTKEQLFAEGVLQPIKITKQQVMDYRAQAYACPLDGVDRLTAQYSRLQIMNGSSDELDKLKDEIINRYNAIKNQFPYPEEEKSG